MAPPPHSHQEPRWDESKLADLLLASSGHVDKFLRDKYTDEQKDWAKAFFFDMYCAANIGKELPKLPDDGVPGPNAKELRNMVQVLVRLRTLDIQIQENDHLPSPKKHVGVSDVFTAEVSTSRELVVANQTQAQSTVTRKPLSQLRPDAAAFEPAIPSESLTFTLETLSVNTDERCPLQHYHLDTCPGHVPRPRNCTECGIHFESSNAYRRHHCSGHAPRPKNCTECGIHFESNNAYHRHLETCPGSTPKPRKCTKCEIHFESNGAYRRHLEACPGITPAKPTKCNQCWLKFQSKNDYRRHLETCGDSYTAGQRESTRCTTCRLQFDSRDELLSHLQQCESINLASSFSASIQRVPLTTSPQEVPTVPSTSKPYNFLEEVATRIQTAKLEEEDQKVALEDGRKEQGKQQGQGVSLSKDLLDRQLPSSSALGSPFVPFAIPSKKEPVLPVKSVPVWVSNRAIASARLAEKEKENAPFKNGPPWNGPRSTFKPDDRADDKPENKGSALQLKTFSDSLKSKMLGRLATEEEADRVRQPRVKKPVSRPVDKTAGLPSVDLLSHLRPRVSSTKTAKTATNVSASGETEVPVFEADDLIAWD